MRCAKIDDLPHIRDIYDHYVHHSSITFDLTTPPIDSFAQKFESSHVFLLAEQGGVILGYAYANEHRYKAAYQWATESTIYLHKDHLNKKIGGPLYLALLDLLQHLGYLMVLAGITRPNPSSERFHERLGFKKIFSYEDIGYKKGQWHSVDWYRKDLMPPAAQPTRPKRLESLDTEILESILGAHSTSN
ncbi:MAG: N-acetyltransferase [Flavobacteriales bacterium]|nr:N-acetyltransferase [Flavobacteriales bacterium]